MLITHKITMALDRKGYMQRIDVVQGDANTRALELELRVDRKPVTLPAGATASVAYRKPDGTRKEYGTLPDGTPACVLNSSSVTAYLEPEMLDKPGRAYVSVIMHEAEERLSTYPIEVNVTANVAVTPKETEVSAR